MLGDQSARSLRGKQMLDVIFSGSGTRKSSGMAQVDLRFDNADRKLNLDTDEVTISRRLYRSGESEYLINNETVRLKDVKELFMDTGVGVGAYSIIEQGKVDVLLQANPQERRLIFEEAAGISRYKSRKKEAERKLGRVNQNLLRLEDIIEEVEKRLRSIKLQAGKARNFQEYDRQLREKRSMYALSEFHRLTQRKAELSGKVAGLQDEGTQLRSAIDTAETKISVLDGELLTLDADIRQLEQQILTNTSEITGNRERIEQSRERMDELSQARSRALQRLSAERQRVGKLRQQIKNEEASAGRIEQDLSEATATVDRLREEDHSLLKRLTELRARHEDEKAGIIDLLRKTAQVHNQIESLKQRRQQLEGERNRLANRNEQVETELRILLEERSQIERRAEEITALIAAENVKLDEKKREAAQADAARAELNQQLAAAKEYRSGLLSRQQLLGDLEQRFEGVDAGVREMLRRKEEDATGESFPYLRGMIADLISVDVSNAMLIETALGDYDQYLVLSDSAAFIRDGETLADFPGRVNAICLDRIPAYVNGRDFSGQEGFVAYAMDLVGCPEDVEPLIKHLLGHTIIVRTIDDAVRLAEQNPPSFRYVTQSGEMLDPQGFCQLGPAGGRTGLISRKSELREIEKQVSEVDERIASMSEKLEATSSDIAHLEQVQQQLRNAIYEGRTAEVENNAALGNTVASIDRLKREQPLIAGEVEAVELQMHEAAEHSSRSSESLTQLEQDNQHRESRIKELDEQIAQASQQQERVAEQMTEAKVSFGQLAQRRSMAADTLRGLNESLQSSEETMNASATESADTAHRIEQAERTVLNAESRLAELYADKERLDREIIGRQRRRTEIRREMESLSGQAKTSRSRLTEVDEKLHRIEMESQEVRMRVEDLVSRTQEELAIDLAESYAGYQYDAEMDWDAVEAEIAELKGKIQRLGNVNLDAISEQEELEQRSSFLTGQRDDLRQSQQQLEELIEQLNKECRDRFMETFEAVRGHFQELFRKLFGGGKADVILELPLEGEEIDVLEAGIEIQARPPGKEIQSISLMSGGEKTMSAIALLLAIFRSRPSPFAILDEVDAALDEANNERFNRIVREFLDHSQFIVITHSKRTMTIADVLYGVTMQEAGVSKRVSVKFDTDEGERAAVA